MKVTIVCESMFGNTEYLAEQVAGGLTDAGADVSLLKVGEVVASDCDGIDLLVVAAPTHALTLSRPESRAEAVARGAEPSRAVVGVREWLDTIDLYFPGTAPRPLVAVFDTRVEKARHWPGSAARRAACGFRKAEFEVVERTSFYVEGVTGPLADGESDRARAWGTGLSVLVNQAVESRRGVA